METGTLRSWSKKEGEKISEGIYHPCFKQFLFFIKLDHRKIYSKTMIRG